MINQIASIRYSDDDPEKIEDQITSIRFSFLSKWGHHYICQLNDNDLLFIKLHPIKLCSHWKKGEAKNKQNMAKRKTTKERPVASAAGGIREGLLEQRERLRRRRRRRLLRPREQRGRERVALVHTAARRRHGTAAALVREVHVDARRELLPRFELRLPCLPQMQGAVAMMNASNAGHACARKEAPMARGVKGSPLAGPWPGAHHSR